MKPADALHPRPQLRCGRGSSPWNRLRRPRNTDARGILVKHEVRMTCSAVREVSVRSKPTRSGGVARGQHFRCGRPFVPTVPVDCACSRALDAMACSGSRHVFWPNSAIVSCNRRPAPRKSVGRVPHSRHFEGSLSAEGVATRSLHRGALRLLRGDCVGGHVSGQGVVVAAAAAGVGVSAALVSYPLPEALLFDCDGVLVDTERDGHRISFNIVFGEKGFDTDWDVDLYGELLRIGGGKERMTHYFNKYGWPKSAPEDVDGRKDLVTALHKRKTDLFMDLVEKGSLPLRPGVARLVDQALEKGVNVAVCSTSNEKAVSAIVRIMLGPERASKIRIFAGDVVPLKKPNPAIYLLASSTLGVAPERCVVIEDSHIGLTAAKAAGMRCIVTKSGYTEDENFAAADAVFDSIGDPPNANFDLDFAASLLSLPEDAVA